MYLPIQIALGKTADRESVQNRTQSYIRDFYGFANSMTSSNKLEIIDNHTYVISTTMLRTRCHCQIRIILRDMEYMYR